jgi:hypothetical protein
MEGNPNPLNEDNAATDSILSSGLGNGVNLQPSYYNGGNVDLGWSLMAQYTKIKAVRIEIEPGQETNAQRWINEALTNGYTTIATHHKFQAPLGSDDVNELFRAADWWVANYQNLQASGRFMINLMNEWGSHAIKANDFAAAYNRAITAVRTVYDGPIIIDIPGFGQEAHTASLAVTGAANETIADPNIILSTHIYPNAWNAAKKREMTKADIDELGSTGVNCMVGEFGDDGSSGRTKWSDLVAYAKSQDWPVFGWAWNGDGGSMNMITPQFQPFVGGQAQPYTESPYFNTIYNNL